jgi:hypothetical protein
MFGGAMTTRASLIRGLLTSIAAASLALAFAACDDDGGTCSATQTSCGGQCVDTSKDPANCGACGTKCDTAKGETCNGGKC